MTKQERKDLFVGSLMIVAICGLVAYYWLDDVVDFLIGFVNHMFTAEGGIFILIGCVIGLAKIVAKNGQVRKEG